MRVLVPGGAGFLGRSVVGALEARGHAVVVGSRKGSCEGGPEGGASRRRRMRFESLLSADAWAPHLAGIDAVVNCVGILRERGRETYDRLHHLAPAALGAACAARGVRLVHVSALGLDARARSGFIASKRRGEAAIRDSGADYTLARPSLLEGEGGFGARWLRALARMPLWFSPADATGLIAALDVGDAERPSRGSRTCPGATGARRTWPGSITARSRRISRRFAGTALRRASCAFLRWPRASPATRLRCALHVVATFVRLARCAGQRPRAALDRPLGRRSPRGSARPRSSVCARSRSPCRRSRPAMVEIHRSRERRGGWSAPRRPRDLACWRRTARAGRASR